MYAPRNDGEKPLQPFLDKAAVKTSLGVSNPVSSVQWKLINECP